MICKNCGNYHDDSLKQCPVCGAPAQQYQQPVYNQNATPQYAQPVNAVDEDKPSTAINLVSLLLLPILGIIIYFVEKDKHPIKAKSALKFGISGWVLSFVMGLISVVFSLLVSGALSFLPLIMEEFM